MREDDTTTMNDDSTGTDFTAGLPGAPDETPTGDTSTDEAPAVGEELAGGGEGDENAPVGEPGEGGVTPDEEEQVAGDGTEAGLSEGDAGAADDGEDDEELAGASDPTDPPADDELRGAGAVAPTSGDNLPGQTPLVAKMQAAEAARGEAPFATPQIANNMVDTAANGGTSIKAAVTTAEAAQQTALANAHTTNAANAAQWRADRGIDVNDRHTRPITQQQD